MWNVLCSCFFGGTSSSSDFQSGDKQTLTTTTNVANWKEQYPTRFWHGRGIDEIDKNSRNILRSLQKCSDLNSEKADEVGRHLFGLAKTIQEKEGTDYMYDFFIMKLTNLSEEKNGKIYLSIRKAMMLSKCER